MKFRVRAKKRMMLIDHYLDSDRLRKLGAPKVIYCGETDNNEEEWQDIEGIHN